MSLSPNSAVTPLDMGRYQDNHVVLVVEDHQDPRSELNEVLAQNGYRVIGTDNGQDAARQARQVRPDLLLIDLDVPLLFELVAARQILKQAQLWQLPVVIVTHEDVIDSGSIMEVGARRNEYVTRFSEDDQLQDLLDYLLPVLPPATANELTTSNNFRADAGAHPERSFSPNDIQLT
jgi:DNA-binding response OmpR family regulator